jgi:uncharacterized repeat protein (TIGR03803 family)
MSVGRHVGRHQRRGRLRLRHDLQALSPQSGGKRSETILCSFANDGPDGDEINGNPTTDIAGGGPSLGVIPDAAGNLYGVTIGGGDKNCDCGAVFDLSPQGGDKWTYTVLHRFTGDDGAQPAANLTVDG